MPEGYPGDLYNQVVDSIVRVYWRAILGSEELLCYICQQLGKAKMRAYAMAML